MNITLEKETLDYINANLDGVTPELWVERKVNALVKRLIKDEVIAKINSSDATEAARYHEAVKTVEAVIVEEKAALTPVIEEVL